MNFRKLTLIALLSAIGSSHMQAEDVSKLDTAKEAITNFLKNAKENVAPYFTAGKESVKDQIKKFIGVNDASYLAFNLVATAGACYGLKNMFEGLFPAKNEECSTSKIIGGTLFTSLFVATIFKSKDILKAFQ